MFMNWTLIIIQNYRSADCCERKMKSPPVSKTRWRRENVFFQKIQHEIDKETQSVSDTTGLNPWIILGTKSLEYFLKILRFAFYLHSKPSFVFKTFKMDFKEFSPPGWLYCWPWWSTVPTGSTRKKGSTIRRSKIRKTSRTKKLSSLLRRRWTCSRRKLQRWDFDLDFLFSSNLEGNSLWSLGDFIFC